MSPNEKASDAQIHKKPCLTSEMLDSIVVLKAGPAKTEYRVHRGLLCQSSPYFRAALEGGFKEAETQIIEWPEEESATVKIFQLWLYSGSLGVDLGDGLSTWRKLVDTYHFADVYHLPALKESIIDVSIDLQLRKSTFNVEVLDIVYRTPSAKPLQKLFMDMAVHNWSLTETGFLREKLLKHYPKQYLVDVVIELHKHDVARKWTLKDYQAARAKYSHTSTD